MISDEVMKQFIELDDEEKAHFYQQFGTYLTLRLGDGSPVIMQWETYRQMEVKSRLYAEVKRVLRDVVEPHL